MSSALVWFRRDLRDFDNAALAHALYAHERVHCAFVFDRTILDGLDSRQDRRVAFIHASLIELDAALRARGGGLLVVHDHAERALPRLARELGVRAVYCNRDYEPAARKRDAAVEGALNEHAIAFHAFKDHVVLDTDEVMTQAGRPYAVFTPYRNAWLKRVTDADLAAHRTEDARGRLASMATPMRGSRTRATGSTAGVPSLASIGFVGCDLAQSGIEPGMAGGRRALERFLLRVDDYAGTRDFPAQPGTSRLSVHLRFGTVSIRELARAAQRRAQHGSAGAIAWRNELVWREFYSQLLWHYPRVADGPFRLEYRRLRFRDDEAAFAAWCVGRTGYPLVDAAMRELTATGWMHNRLRMITASFLVKDLLVDWRRGERFFAVHLLDYDLASNNGGWQWAASTGCDAQPWFRIFNPITQSERFDPDGAYIRSRVAELAGLEAPDIHAPWRVPAALLEAKGIRLGETYPVPMVDHAAARLRALEAYGVVKG